MDNLEPATEAKKNGSKRSTVIIERKNLWPAYSAKFEGEHWKRYHLVIKLRGRMHGGQPATLDAAKAMLNARGLGELVEAREAEIPAEERAETVVDEGLCQFHRREGKPGLWWPANNFKACIKENWSALGYNMDATPRSKRKAMTAEEKKITKAIRGSRGGVAEALFVVSCDPIDPHFIYLADKPHGIVTSVSHHIGPKGPQSSIKRNEYVEGIQLNLEIKLAQNVENKVPLETMMDVLYHAQEHGIGANRSQGVGTFDVLSVEEL